MITVVATKRDLQHDAKRRAAEVPPNRIEEAVEGLQAALTSATGDLKIWLQAALQSLQEREQLSKSIPSTKNLKNQ
jgi:hypothetical protein